MFWFDESTELFPLRSLLSSFSNAIFSATLTGITECELNRLAAIRAVLVESGVFLGLCQGFTVVMPFSLESQPVESFRKH